MLDGGVAVGLEPKNYGELSLNPLLAPHSKGEILFRAVPRVRDSVRLLVLTVDTNGDQMFFTRARGGVLGRGALARRSSRFHQCGAVVSGVGRWWRISPMAIEKRKNRSGVGSKE